MGSGGIVGVNDSGKHLLQVCEEKEGFKCGERMV